MSFGTVYHTGKMLAMTCKWEQKKASGTILRKDKSELSLEERQLQMYKEQLRQEREGNEYSAIYAKIASGQELSPEEEEKLRAKDPKMYAEYRADRMEQEAYERRLEKCKTKEEAERLHVNRMNAKLSELRTIVNNPNIPKGEKLKEAQRIMGDTTRIAKVFHKFTGSPKFQKIPTEEEVMASNQAESTLPEEVHTDEKVSGDKENEEELPDTSDDAKNICDVHESEKKILEEMFELEEKHFGESIKTVRVDVSL